MATTTLSGRWPVVAASRLSLLGAAVSLCFDVGLDGSYLFSALACPIWLLVSVVKNLIWPPGWRVALFRIAIPPLTLGIAIGNTALQWKIAETNADRIIKAVEEFHVINGRFPKTLDELVPKYLPSIPRAKYCMAGTFWYFNYPESQCMLMWSKLGFYRKIYNFDMKRWGAVD
jgi:hypothetical protein